MQRLFERLTHAQARRERLAQSQASSVFDRQDSPALASIKSHLSRLLNTRRGSALIDAHYGLPILGVTPNNNSLADRGAMATLIRQTLERYETRLRDITVNISPCGGDDVGLDCAIRAHIRPELLPTGVDTRIELQAQLMTDGTLVFH